MLLYHCPQCGHWEDITIAKAFTNWWNNAMQATPTAQIVQLDYPCPAGHGLMEQVMQYDRIFVRPGVVEQAVLKEGNEEA